MTNNMHKRVSFKDKVYWLHGPTYGNVYNISPLNHYSEDGEVLADPFRDISFAILEGDKIMQFGHEIGTVSDLIDVI